MSVGRPTPSSRHAWVLPSVLVAAILVHIGFFLSVHQMKLVFAGASKPWAYEDQTIADTEASVRDQESKNAQLAHVFKQIVADASGGEAASIPLASQSSDYLPPAVENLPTDWQQATFDLSLTSAGLSDGPNDFVLDPLAVEIVVPSDKLLIDHLVQATEALLGDVDILTADAFDPESARGGSSEWASLQGNALENRSGMRHDGVDDPSYTNYPQLAGAQGANDFEHSLQQQAEKEQSALTDQLNSHLQNHAAGSSSLRDSEGDRPLAGAEVSGRVASSSDFNVSVEFAPRPQGGGYLFRLVLTPKQEVAFKTIKHNVFFLIDRSHSIDKNRYAATKQAVYQALGLMREGDTFNLLVFDNKVSAFAPQSVPVTDHNIAVARAFLDQQTHGGLFATTDLYTSLGNIVPNDVGPKELNTAVLLSDGETYLSKDKQRQSIASWTAQNSGKVALYSLAVGKGNNLPLLDLLTSLNRGKLSYCASTNQIQDCLGQLLTSVRNPIGKDIVGSVVSVKEGNIVTLYPRQARLPNLYRDSPYVLFGCCSRMEDFFVFLQGRYYDRFLDIKQRVSFSEAKRVTTADLERQWAIQQAYELYDRYLQEGKANALTEARRILAPYGIPVAFQ